MGRKPQIKTNGNPLAEAILEINAAVSDSGDKGSTSEIVDIMTFCDSSDVHSMKDNI